MDGLMSISAEVLIRGSWLVLWSYSTNMASERDHPEAVENTWLTRQSLAAK